MKKSAEKLLEKARQNGSIKYTEIVKVLADTDPDYEELVTTLQEEDIEIDMSLEEEAAPKRRGRPKLNKVEEPKEETSEELEIEEDDIDSLLDDDNQEVALDEEPDEFEDLDLDEEDDSSFYTDDSDVPQELFDNFDDLIYSQASNKNEKIAVDDSVKMYLKELGRIELLTPEEEVQVATKIDIEKKRKAAYDQKIAEGYTPTPEEEAEMKEIIEEGERAKRILTEANLRLVVHIAKQFTANSGMQFADLIQEGSSGLLKAVNKFDVTRGNKFSTYATGWIKQAITRAIADQARTIRIPVHMNETINKLNKKERELSYELNRKPSIAELAEAMHMSEDKILMIKRVSQKTKSLEDPVGEEEDSTYGDFIRDTENPNPEEYASNEALKHELDILLQSLNEREEKVIRMRFGLDDGRSRTLEEVGKEFNVTRERIRQIEAKALRKLKHPSRMNKLKDFVK